MNIIYTLTTAIYFAKNIIRTNGAVIKEFTAWNYLILF